MLSFLRLQVPFGSLSGVFDIASVGDVAIPPPARDFVAGNLHRDLSRNAGAIILRTAVRRRSGKKSVAVSSYRPIPLRCSPPLPWPSGRGNLAFELHDGERLPCFVHTDVQRFR